MRGHSPHRVLVLLAALLGSLWFAGPAEAAQVTRFSPQGTVKQVRQASSAFSEPMVAFGDPVAADPFDVTCPVPGQGRWVDTGDYYGPSMALGSADVSLWELVNAYRALAREHGAKGAEFEYVFLIGCTTKFWVISA
jgi:hypothetical protein